MVLGSYPSDDAAECCLGQTQFVAMAFGDGWMDWRLTLQAEAMQQDTSQPVHAFARSNRDLQQVFRIQRKKRGLRDCSSHLPVG